MNNNYWKFFRILVLTFICFIFWIILAQEYNYIAYLYGLIIALIASYYSYNIFIRDYELHKTALIFRIDLLFIYFFYLFIESYIASYELLKVTIKRSYNPRVVRIKTKLRSKLGRMLLANSISLVPGTLSLWLEDKYIIVHCFNIDTQNSIKAGRIIKARLEKFLFRIFQ